MKRNEQTIGFLDAYVRNLERAAWIRSMSGQLAGAANRQARGPMVLNPYALTIAQLGITDFRSSATAGADMRRP